MQSLWTEIWAIIATTDRRMLASEYGLAEFSDGYRAMQAGTKQYFAILDAVTNEAVAAGATNESTAEVTHAIDKHLEATISLRGAEIRDAAARMATTAIGLSNLHADPVPISAENAQRAFSVAYSYGVNLGVAIHRMVSAGIHEAEVHTEGDECLVDTFRRVSGLMEMGEEEFTIAVYLAVKTFAMVLEHRPDADPDDPLPIKEIEEMTKVVYVGGFFTGWCFDANKGVLHVN